MGIFDWFFGREKKEKKIALKVSELSAFLQELENRKERYMNAQPILEDIIFLIEGIKENTQSINSAEDLEDTPKRLVNILNTSKPSFIKAMLESTQELEKIPEEKDLKAYQRKLDDFLGSAPKLILGQGRYLHYSHGEKLGEIKKDLKCLLEKKRELDELLREDTYLEIEADIKSLEEKMIRRQALEAEEKTLKKTLDEKIAAEKELRERYESIEETECFKEHAENKKSLEETIKERERLENRLYNLMTPIKKTLKTINHTLEKDHSLNIPRKELAAYAEKPVEEFISQDMKKTKQFFSDIKSLLEKEALGLEKDRTRKTKSIIDEILSPETEKTRQKLAYLVEEEKQKSEQMNQSPYLKERENLEKDLEKAGRELHQTQDGYKKIAKKIAQTSEEIDALKNKLEEEITRKKGDNVVLDL
jgi:hypothetical protein